MAYCCARRKALGGLLLAGIAVGTGVVGWKRFAAAPVELPEAEVCLDAPPSAYDPASGLALSAARPIPVDARCPVCGMFPARSKEWAAQVIFNNGDAHFFDSPVSFFLFVQNMERFMPGRGVQEVVAAYVTDSAQPTPPAWIAAESAFYVHGSNALGPMRSGNLPAFSDAGAAQAFAQRRGGQVLAYAQVDAQIVTSLAPAGSHQHAEIDKKP